MFQASSVGGYMANENNAAGDNQKLQMDLDVAQSSILAAIDNWTRDNKH